MFEGLVEELSRNLLGMPIESNQPLNLEGEVL
jgi:hypothetical protein